MQPNYHFWGNGESKDIAMSFEDYLEIPDVLLDDRLSRKMMMRMKNLYEVNSIGIILVPIYIFPIAYLMNKLILGPEAR